MIVDPERERVINYMLVILKIDALLKAYGRF